MQIQLTDADIKKMPYPLRSELLRWFEQRNLRSLQSLSYETFALKDASPQLALDISHDSVKSDTKSNHVRLTQLFDAGITTSGMPVRIKLLRKQEKRRGYGYVTANLEISPTGTVIYQGEEFHKPSPLVKQVIGSAVNGWDYIEVCKNGHWVCLGKLREIWREHHE